MHIKWFSYSDNDPSNNDILYSNKFDNQNSLIVRESTTGRVYKYISNHTEINIHFFSVTYLRVSLSSDRFLCFILHFSDVVLLTN